MRQVLNIIARAIFPQQCAYCQRAATQFELQNWQQFCAANKPKLHAFLCKNCIEKLIGNDVACLICQQPLAATSKPNLRCGRCQKSMPAVNKVIAPYQYQGIIRELLRRYKFGNAYYIEPVLADLLCKHSDFEREIDAIIAMPMHYKRLLERGFNHAEALAKRVSAHMGKPLLTKQVLRCKITPRFSKGQKRAQRLKIIKGSFEVVAALPPRILIIDDVMTTGASCNELAKTLKKHGAQEVYALVLARVG